MLGYEKRIQEEIKELESLCKNIPVEFIKLRIQEMGKWYIRNAYRNKTRFYMFSYISIIAPLVITAFNTLNITDNYVVQMVTVICSVITSFSTSCLALTRCLEKWKIYRDSVEHIKSLLTYYWANKTDNMALKNLCYDLETLRSVEYKRWTDTYETLKKDTNN